MHQPTNPWRITQVSTPGVHAQEGISSDVTQHVLLSDTYCGILADGAGSAKYARFGAEQSCAFAMHLIKTTRSLQEKIEKNPKLWGGRFIGSLRKHLQEMAENKGCSLRDFACTFNCVIIWPDAFFYCNVGDSNLVTRTIGEESYQQWGKSRNEFINVTHFVTEENSSYQAGFMPKKVGFVCQFSDGLAHVALDQNNNHVPYDKFFRPFEDFFAQTPQSKRRSEDLRKFLQSPQLQARSEDDKSLSIAWRKA